MRVLCSSPQLMLPNTDRSKPVETGIFILGASAHRAPPKIWTMCPPLRHLIGGAAANVIAYRRLGAAVNLTQLPPSDWLQLHLWKKPNTYI